MALHKCLRIAVVLGLSIAALGGSDRTAFAACTSPSGIGGTITWNGTDSVIWCDGTNWYALKNAAGSSGSAGYIQFSNGSGGFSNSGTTAGQQLFWDDTNKWLGLGTATPVAKLGIAVTDTTTYSMTGLSTVPSGSTGLSIINQNNSDASYASLMLQNRLASVASGQIAVTGGNTTSALTFGVRPTSGAAALYEYMRITAAGKVGIGTAAPSTDLAFGGEAARTIGIERTSAGTTGKNLTISAGGSKAATADLNGGNLYLSSGIATGTGSSNIYFQTATAQASTATTDNTPSTAMTILGNNNVGIGTTAPEYKLHLFDSVGGAEATLLQLHNRSGGNGTAAGIAFSPSMNAGTGLRIVGTQFNNSDTRFQFYTYGPDGSVQRMILHSWGLAIGPASSNLNGQININGARSTGAWNQYGAGLVLAGGPYTDTSSSGTVAKNQIHVVYGSTLAATNATTYTRAANFVVGPVTAGTNVTITNPLSFVVDSGKSAFWGNVGIGTDSPTYHLSLGGDVVRVIGMERTTAGTNGYRLTLAAGGAKAGTADLNGGDLVFESGTATGTGSSNIYFSTATPGATATTDRAPSSKMAILGNGNVGIGTNYPSYTLSFAKEGTRTIGVERSSPNNSGSTLILSAGGGALGVADKGGGNVEIVSGIATGTGSSNIYFKTATSSATGTTDNTPDTKMTILGSGYVGIGTTTPTALLHVYGSASSQTKVNSGDLSISSNNTSTPILNVAGGSGADLIRLIGASSAPVLYATSAGNVLIGRTTTSSASTPAGLTIQHTYGVNYGLVLVSDNVGSSSVARFDNPNGNVGSIILSGTSTTYTTTSDRRLKDNITDTENGLDRVMRIPVRDFSFKSDATHTKQTGFIAQELAKVMPEAVARNGDDGTAPLAEGKTGWSVDYGRVTPLLLKAIQELKAANDNLREIVEEQGAEIEALKAAVSP